MDLWNLSIVRNSKYITSCLEFLTMDKVQRPSDSEFCNLLCNEYKILVKAWIVDTELNTCESDVSKKYQLHPSSIKFRD
jgi:hypothetical protein